MGLNPVVQEQVLDYRLFPRWINTIHRIIVSVYIGVKTQRSAGCALFRVSGPKSSSRLVVVPRSQVIQPDAAIRPFAQLSCRELIRILSRMDLGPRLLVIVDPDRAGGCQLREANRMRIAVRMGLRAAYRRDLNPNIAARSVQRPGVRLERPVFDDERVYENINRPKTIRTMLRRSHRRAGCGPDASRGDPAADARFLEWRRNERSCLVEPAQRVVRRVSEFVPNPEGVAIVRRRARLPETEERRDIHRLFPRIQGHMAYIELEITDRRAEGFSKRVVAVEGVVPIKPYDPVLLLCAEIGKLC
jgi:hypothetical protein